MIPRMFRTTSGSARSHGFSMLELTLVLAIIAALMGVAAFNVFRGADRAKARATRATFQVIKTAVTQYRTEKNAFPPTLETLVTAGYIEDFPLDGWKQEIYYTVPGLSGRDYDLISYGPDGRLDTEDDISVWDQDEG